MELKIPFLQTRAGQWIKKNAPTLIDTVKDFVPAPVKGAMTMVQNLVGLQSNLSNEQKSDFNAIAAEHEEEVIKLYNEEMSSARNREVEITKITGKKDNILWALSMAGILIPVLLLGYLIYTGKPVDPLVAGFVGVIVGSYMVVFNYHFGSSSGSAKKQETIDTMMSVEVK